MALRVHVQEDERETPGDAGGVLTAAAMGMSSGELTLIPGPERLGGFSLVKDREMFSRRRNCVQSIEMGKSIMWLRNRRVLYVGNIMSERENVVRLRK